MKTSKHSRTTFGSIVAALGLMLSHSPNAIVKWIGDGLTILGTVVLGTAAADAREL